jgi:hypothetical protein
MWLPHPEGSEAVRDLPVLQPTKFEMVIQLENRQCAPPHDTKYDAAAC